MEDLDLATVATFSVRHEAEVARARLAAAGIPAVVHADDEGGLNPGFFADYGIRVAVRREQLDAAGVVLGEDPGHAAGIVLHPEHLEALLAHARFSAPEEACGLLAFDETGRLRFVYCLTNADRSAHRFTVDPTEHYHALQHAERSGWEIAGDFHSHPRGRAEPSPTDIEAAAAASWIHLVVGLGSSQGPRVRAFLIDEGRAVEVGVAVG